MLRVRILSGAVRTGGVPPLGLPGLTLPALGPGLGLLLELGVGTALPVPRPLILTDSCRTGMFVIAL
jgi:hypothetical protein